MCTASSAVPAGSKYLPLKAHQLSVPQGSAGPVHYMTLSPIFQGRLQKQALAEGVLLGVSCMLHI